MLIERKCIQKFIEVIQEMYYYVVTNVRKFSFQKIKNKKTNAVIKNKKIENVRVLCGGMTRFPVGVMLLLRLNFSLSLVAQIQEGACFVFFGDVVLVNDYLCSERLSCQVF